MHKKSNNKKNNINKKISVKIKNSYRPSLQNFSHIKPNTSVKSLVLYDSTRFHIALKKLHGWARIVHIMYWTYMFIYYITYVICRISWFYIKREYRDVVRWRYEIIFNFRKEDYEAIYIACRFLIPTYLKYWVKKLLRAFIISKWLKRIYRVWQKFFFFLFYRFFKSKKIEKLSSFSFTFLVIDFFVLIFKLISAHLKFVTYLIYKLIIYIFEFLKKLFLLPIISIITVKIAYLFFTIFNKYTSSKNYTHLYKKIDILKDGTSDFFYSFSLWILTRVDLYKQIFVSYYQSKLEILKDYKEDFDFKVLFGIPIIPIFFTYLFFYFLLEKHYYSDTWLNKLIKKSNFFLLNIHKNIFFLIKNLYLLLKKFFIGFIKFIFIKFKQFFFVILIIFKALNWLFTEYVFGIDLEGKKYTNFIWRINFLKNSFWKIIDFVIDFYFNYILPLYYFIIFDKNINWKENLKLKLNIIKEKIKSYKIYRQYIKDYTKLRIFLKRCKYIFIRIYRSLKKLLIKIKLNKYISFINNLFWKK